MCQLFEENNASFLMGLSTSIANSTTNFLQARQSDCIDKDLGFIKLATDIGLVTVTSGNFTALVAPSINRIRLKLLDNFTLDKFIPANSSIIQNDTISGPASNLRANLCSLSISAIPSTNADSMSITVASLLDDINKNKESPSIPQPVNLN
ncbi:hypothetical protein BCR33DRAFT_456178 [Rhizoclosmatium globosum]|uniref:Uncharacterized protein n=1 Tax=Rhizoclosmatium globosum TaxID=329046 RepID=A0A1Y2CWS0_9FUNG|nr:hypothetical protein BCR33DRAFT_456178 [Rhizoclosmatium globosum]|eukprot:ORY51482.1 hypothetical protein BCR33DRAFT_456178 [Rhizoclosmatium globosum]